MGRRGKPRAIGRKGAQRRVRPLHQVRRSPIVKSVHCHNVLYVAMGECDRKLRLVVGGNYIHTVTRHNVPMLPNQKDR